MQHSGVWEEKCQFPGQPHSALLSQRWWGCWAPLAAGSTPTAWRLWMQILLVFLQSTEFSTVLLAWDLHTLAFKGLSSTEGVEGNQKWQNQKIYTAVCNRSSQWALRFHWRDLLRLHKPWRSKNCLSNLFLERLRWIGRYILPEWKCSSGLLHVAISWFSRSVPYFIFRFHGVSNAVIFILFHIYFFRSFALHGLHHILVFSGDGFLIVTCTFTPWSSCCPWVMAEIKIQ